MVALTFSVACGGSAATTTMLPSLSVLDSVDSPPAPAAPTGCVEGFQTTVLSHTGYAAAFVRGSDDIWHAAYALDYQDAKGTTYTGMRAGDSTSPTDVQSIAWVDGSSMLTEDGSNTATLFYASADTQQGRKVMMARSVGGSWQVDPTPVWTGVASDYVVDLRAGFDRSGFAHVVIQLAGQILIGSNSGGSWSVSDFTIVEPNLHMGGGFFNINQFLVDGDGHTHMTFNWFGGQNVYVSDSSGQWAGTAIVTEQNGAAVLALDANSTPHLFSWYKSTNSIHDSHQTAQGFADQDLAIPTMVQDVTRATIDASGGVHLLLEGQSYLYVTNAGGTVTSLIPPDPSDSDQTVRFVLDAKGQPHFAYSYNPSIDHPATFAMAFADPCQ
jgi:hypothetical protein